MRRVLLQSGRYCLFEGFSFCATGGSFSKFISQAIMTPCGEKNTPQVNTRVFYTFAHSKTHTLRCCAVGVVAKIFSSTQSSLVGAVGGVRERQKSDI